VKAEEAVWVRRLFAIVVVIAVFGMPTYALGAAGPIQNVAPPNGTTIPVQEGQFKGIPVEFGCPTYANFPPGLGYNVIFGTSPELNPEGAIAKPFRVATNSMVSPVNAAEDVCRGELPSYAWETPSTQTTYYWQIQRPQCFYAIPVSGEECVEYGPVWGFNLSRTPKASPTVPTFTPTPIEGEGAVPHQKFLGIEGWTGCGLVKVAERSLSCYQGSTVGAFFRATRETTYSLCLTFPSSREECVTNQHADAQTTYVNKIDTGSVGTYELVWEAEGKRVTKALQILPEPHAKRQRTPRQNRACPNVKTRFLLAWSVEAVPGFACSGARKVIRQYFKQVEASAQTNGGCAQKRSTRGCKVGRYRCFTGLAREVSQLEGRCRGAKGRVYFNENDRGPN
jgi:hypothetical protein